MVPRTAAAAEVADDQPADKQSKILIVTCGVNNMERCGCTMQKGEWCWRNYIRKKYVGDSNTVKFYVADDLIEFNSNLRYRFKLLRPRNILYVDCRIFKDRGDADVGLHHTGRLPECLDRIVSSDRFINFYKQLWASIRKMRGRYPDGDIAIVLACRSGRQRSESIRYILEKHLEEDGVDFQSVAMSSHGQWNRLCTKRQGAWQKCDLCSHKDVQDEKRVADLVASANRIRSDKRFNDKFRSAFRLVQTRSGLKPMSGWIDPPVLTWPITLQYDHWLAMFESLAREALTTGKATLEEIASKTGEEVDVIRAVIGLTAVPTNNLISKLSRILNFQLPHYDNLSDSVKVIGKDMP